MAWNADGTRRATCIFEAGCWRYAVKVVCRCGHSASFDPWGLWWLFERRGWDDTFGVARMRFWCRICAARLKRKVRADRIMTAPLGDADLQLPRPPEREWRRAISRFRS